MLELNRVLLIGNLTQDPEVRYLPSGMAVAKLRLASNHRYRDRNGEQREDTLFITADAWGKQAEFCQQYLAKGKRIFVEGRLKMDSYQTQDGQQRNEIRINVDRIQFADARPGAGEQVVDESGDPAAGSYQPPAQGGQPGQGGYAAPAGGYAPPPGGYAPAPGGYAPAGGYASAPPAGMAPAYGNPQARPMAPNYQRPPAPPPPPAPGGYYGGAPARPPVAPVQRPPLPPPPPSPSFAAAPAAAAPLAPAAPQETAPSQAAPSFPASPPQPSSPSYSHSQGFPSGNSYNDSPPPADSAGGTDNDLPF